MRGKTIRQQFGIVTVVVILSFLAINLTLAYSVRSILFRKNVEYVRYAAEKYMQEIAYIDEEAQAVMNFLQYSGEIHDYFDREKHSSAYYIFSEMDTFLARVQIIYPELDDIVLIGEHRDRTKIKDEEITLLLSRYSGSGKNECVGILDQKKAMEDGYQTLAFTAMLYGNDFKENYAQPIGACILSIKMDSLLYEDSYSGETAFFMVDEYGKQYALNGAAQREEGLLERIEYAPFEGTLYTPQYLITSQRMDQIPLTIVGCTDKKSLLKDAEELQILIFCLGCLSVLILLLLLYFTYRSLIRPVYALNQYMHGISSGNYKQIKKKVRVDGNAEMQELAGELNAMIEELEHRSRQLFDTTERMYSIELEKERAEASFLRSQINPHFLYNSLETIRGICNKNDLPVASALAENLGKIFRYSVKGEETVLFREEIMVARAYLEIQAARFSNKVDVLYGIDPAALDVPVIKMILQPVLENVFQHSVEMREEKTTLYLSAFLREGGLFILIQDDGVGIEPETLSRIRDSLNGDGGSGHIGLCNVHRRLRMKYGSSCGVFIESEPGEGTKVTLKLEPFDCEGKGGKE